MRAFDDALAGQVRGERLGSATLLGESFGFDPRPEIPHAQVEPLPPPLAEIFAREPELADMTLQTFTFSG